MINILASTVTRRPSGLGGMFLDFLRTALTFIEGLGYNILAFVYNIFFSVASAEILSSSAVIGFYQRIQLILGVFMMFKLALSIINVIINPDSIKDNQKGLSKIVTRVVVALFLLLLIVPINTTGTVPDADSDDNSLEAKIASNGILFGYLYKFQDSMMRENIIGKLILGTAANTRDPNDPATYVEDYQLNPGESMIATVARAFLQPAVDDNTQPFCKNSSDPDYDENDPCPNVACPTSIANSNYLKDEFNGFTVLENVNKMCNDAGNDISGTAGLFTGDDVMYAFNYIPFAGLICSVIMIVIILGFTVDVAVRSIKLALLRLIAPIPIISYIDPKGKDEGAFNNWVKVLVSTYLDLFIRLMIIYFGAFCIQQIGTGAIDLGDAFNTGTAEGLFAVVFLIIGVLFFMKQAPTFLRQVLGIKGPPMSNIGLSAMLGGLGGLRGGPASGLSAAFDSANAANEAYTQQKSGQPFRQYSMARDNVLKKLTGDKDAAGGVGGFLHRRAGEAMASRYGPSQQDMKDTEDMLKKRAETISNLNNQKDMLGMRLQQFSSEDSNEGLDRYIRYNMSDYVDPKTHKFKNSMVESTYRQGHPEEYKEYQQRLERNQSYNQLSEEYNKILGEVAKAQTEYNTINENYEKGKNYRSTVTVRPETYTSSKRWNPLKNTANEGGTDLYAANIDLHDHGPRSGGGPRPGGGPPPGR